MKNINEVIAVIEKQGFKNYGSFNEGQEQHDVYTCTRGKYEGNVVDIYYNWFTGDVFRTEVSTLWFGCELNFEF